MTCIVDVASLQRHGLTDVVLAAAGPGHWISLHCGGYAAAAGQSSRVMLFDDPWYQIAGCICSVCP